GYVMASMLTEWAKHFRSLVSDDTVVLDLGCGEVPFYESFGRPKNYVTVDWGSSLHPNMYVDHYIDLNSHPIPLDESSVDVIILSDVLEHLYTPDHIIEECERVLKNKGVLLISTPFMYWLHETPHDYARYTPFWYRKKLHHFTLELSVRGGLISFIFDLCLKVLGRVFPFRFLGIMALYILNIRYVRRLDELTSELFPFMITINAIKS
ncbi:class I SAM-dependent methyltransferase, partial [Schleiferiaceae bacterium]|nr:class I SAM-dependent methyltransferase [Schleiferiaceae bacterium]